MFVAMAIESATAAIDDATKQDIDEFIENILSCRNITGQLNRFAGLAPEIHPIHKNLPRRQTISPQNLCHQRNMGQEGLIHTVRFCLIATVILVIETNGLYRI